MKKSLFYCIIFSALFLYSQNGSKISTSFGKEEVDNSVLSNGVWYKIAVDKTGIFKIDRSFLGSLGVNVSNLDPKNIRIYGNGGGVLPENLAEFRYNDLQENAIYVQGEDDGVFDNDDFVLFYAQGPIKWEINARDDIKHIQNPYDKYAYYFLNFDKGAGKRIQTKPSVGLSSTKIVNDFTSYQLYEEDVFNYVDTGRQWFGDEIVGSKFINFNFPNVITTEDVLLNSKLAVTSSKLTTIGFSINNSVITSLSKKIREKGFKFDLFEAKNSFNVINDNISIGINWTNASDPSASVRLDYIELVADRELRGNNKQFKAFNFESKSSGEVLEYQIRDASKIDLIWDVTDPINPSLLTNLGDVANTFNFKESTDGDLNEYHVISFDDLYQPIKIPNSFIPNQNLHNLKNVHYLIITNSELFSEAERLADFHRNNSQISEANTGKLNVKVVNIEEVYNEFSSGAVDITAIRDFTKFLYDGASSNENRIKFLCLFGDASFDYREIEKEYSQTFIPTFCTEASRELQGSYNSDDYFVAMEVGDYSGVEGELFFPSNCNTGQCQLTLDLAVGRIPVSTLGQAKVVVDKILNYHSFKTRGEWKNVITLLGDDGAEGNDQGLIQDLENSAKIIEGNIRDLNLQKLYSDAFEEVITSGGERYPQVVKRFNDAFANGSLVINYFGHGNEFVLGGENFMDISSIRKFRNFNNLPLYITVTCEFSRFDDPKIVSGGEELLINQFGGAVALFTTSRVIFATTGDLINQKISDFLYDFDGKSRTLGEVLMEVKNNVNKKDEFFVYLFGDPAMKLSIPKPGIKVNSIEEYERKIVNNDTIFEYKNVSQMKSLARIRVGGKVTESDEDDSQTLTDFNGDITLTLFDTPLQRETRKNEGNGSVVSFKSLENKAFIGKATVQNGQFKVEFIVPKDVSLNSGEAKLSFYAADNNSERRGSSFDYQIGGGISENFIKDDTSPEVQVFLDDLTFINGASTTTTPELIVKLFDDSGINTSLSSIGHEISVVIDNDRSNPTTLNDFYIADKDNFTRGTINYELPELELGLHTLELKVWDTHNNISISNVNFLVEDDEKFSISNVLNYPNPFINHTEFWFSNNRARNQLEIRVQVFTISGKLVKTIFGTDINFDGFSRTTTWDGKDDFGNRLAKGVYIYKLKVKDVATGETVEKTEKLVIL